MPFGSTPSRECEPHARRLATWRLGVAGALAIIATGVGPGVHHAFGGVAHWIVVTVTAAAACFAALTAERADRRTALLIIVVAAISMRLMQLFSTPYLSDDIYRYIWDGRVQAAGINPYRHIPAAPELAFLRDKHIYPLINRADYAPTIYPPAAQALFLTVTRFGEAVVTMKLAFLAFEALTIAAIISLLRRFGMPVTRVAAWALHPLPVWEIAGSGHIDAAMVGLLMAGLVLVLSQRRLAGGLLITIGVLMKPTALMALPAIWRPWDWKLPAVVAATIAAFYVPYLSVGQRVFGFLPGYVQEEALSQGTGFRYLLILERMFGPMPHGATAYVVAVAALLMGLSCAVAFQRRRDAVATVVGAGLLLTAFLIALTPHYPWYYLPLVPFLAMQPRCATLWLLTVGGMQTYQAVPGEIMPDYDLRQIVFHLLVLAAVVSDVVTHGIIGWLRDATLARKGDAPA